MFWTMMFIFIFQRLIELTVAKRNEKNAKKRGAVEYGKRHYPFIVAMHALFFVSLISEVAVFHRDIQPLPALILMTAALVLTQGLRYWSLFSLGKYWNTKILVIPETNLIRKGPYQWIKHPNYLAVVLELILLPLLFQAYVTAVVFTICNAVLLLIRIREEERALKELCH
ncbi:isoprenylcysteine carboxylmethyltransferase family protein [Bacillus glycinifermentans]|uniref:isoprenylcysteine carboxyl methyltransferase family protein n=1 Tax=Bacillus glycinifermentans TaxID=1664069 RepID=UPI002DBF0306|nr:isoprenylcysteine carboxylmethyltransferase family protein [Bacillus glycinifermentans]MEC3609066.1 isoprenylcysteine carboxylmethyltransferase family protein [Bacillus glycinifermentans]